MTTVSRRDVIRTGLALSATTLIAGSAAARAEALLAGYSGVPSAEANSAQSPRERLLLDFGWKFIHGHGSDPARDQGFAVDQTEFVKGGVFHICDVKLDDSKWRPLNLPHDWGVELPFVRDEKLQIRGYKPLGRAYPETSVGWYRRVFELPNGGSWAAHHGRV